MTGSFAIFTYGVLCLLWGAILVLYLRYRVTTRIRDPLVALLLTVLALDAARSLFESVYFGLLWAGNYGVFSEVFRALGHPVALGLVKWINVGVAVVVITQVVRRWVPTELAEREAHRREEGRLRRELEASLDRTRESEERFRLAAQAGLHVVWDWDLRQGSLWTSPQGVVVLGLAPDARLTFEDWAARFHPEDRAAVEAGLASLASGASDSWDARHRMAHADGSWRWVRQHALVLRDTRGAPIRVVGHCQDVTQELAAEAAQHQAQRLESVGLLAGGIAHDFNNLLTVVTGNLSLAREDVPDGSDRAELLDAAAEAATRAATLTRQLLDYSGRGHGETQPVDLSALADAIGQLLTVTIPMNVRFDRHLDPTLPAVSADPGQMQQVVLNLVKNAAEAIGPDGGTVTLSTSSATLSEAEAAELDPSGVLQAGPVVRLTVADTGAGMTPAVMGRVFDAFYSTKAQGRGLGLSALIGIVRRHHGAVHVASTPGEGSTFTVILPASAARAADRVAATARPDALDVKVLVVDDQAALRHAMTRMVGRLGGRVVEAPNGAEAVEMSRHDADIDVVLLDMTMPGMSGIATVDALREDRPELPIVLTSGYSEQDPESVAGVVFLPKPFDTDRLATALRAALGR